ncbi:hypothetical protein CVV26_01555 [Candidatus Kuenenbacteria bacterium HGW-Kuenenbacteria-1]|uniref:Uncharacterized protein n=1 Tax=Candidatus Kuenenbacteria bacterium HGW-Kuenenbacteria-1 TaxID=2013812 RepID=A0A2N1UNM6_9BACT|nr:MAG: hypothetical protein CVV26_01555 [Candidatus Kuenenbacteria bacterium HGW-Kuenenbacteria-1]
MSQALENLKQIIIQTNVSEEDKNDILVFLPIFPKEVIETLTEYFLKEPKLIIEFNKNFKSKLKVLTGMNDDEFDKAIRKEEPEEFLEESETEEENLEEDEEE